MKILVDEMPKNIVDCIYSDYEPATFACSGYYMCIYQKPAELCEGTQINVHSLLVLIIIRIELLLVVMD
nr:MAG TPA: hypothetical protein [Caudoviricetes sp.]